MSGKNDPSGGGENAFLDKHDLLKNGLLKSEVVALNIAPADIATINTDNADMHQKKTDADSTAAVAQQATADKTNSIGNGRKNYRVIRQRILKNPGCTPAIADLLGLERTQSQPAGEMSGDGPQPVLRGKALTTGGAEIKSNKGDAEAVDIYSKRDGDADFVFLMRALHFPWVDARPLLAAGKPEKRDYRGQFIRQNKPYGNVSATITLVVSA
jgi:hypothetical protein